MSLLEIKVMKIITRIMCPLTHLPTNIINTVALDYMHNVCLGVVKCLIEFWVRGNKEIHLEKETKNKINNELKNVKPYVSSELCRLPRAIDEIEYYKATELEAFFYYCLVQSFER